MSAPVVKNETKLNIGPHLTEAKTWLTNASGAMTPMKILAGLAVGALLTAAIALPLATVLADEPNKPLVTEEKVIDPRADEYEDELVDPNRASTDLGGEARQGSSSERWRYCE